MGMPGNAEGVRMDELAISQLMGMVKKIRGRKEECVYEYQK